LRAAALADVRAGDRLLEAGGGAALAPRLQRRGGVRRLRRDRRRRPHPRPGDVRTAHHRAGRERAMTAHRRPREAPDEPDVAPVSPLTFAGADAGTGSDAGADAEDRLSALLEFLRRRLNGDYEVDEFGFDRELTDTVLLPLVRVLYRYWFRVELRGTE